MALSATTQAGVIISIFVLPILTYIYFTRSQQKSNTAGPLPPPTEITALFIHPIKSCHGISVQSAKLLPTGLDLGMSPDSEFSQSYLRYTDRQWMWVSYPDYEFLTIRQISK